MSKVLPGIDEPVQVTSPEAEADRKPAWSNCLSSGVLCATVWLPVYAVISHLSHENVAIGLVAVGLALAVVFASVVAFAIGVWELLLVLGRSKRAPRVWHVLLGFAALAVMPATVIPEINKPTPNQVRTQDLNNLRQLGLGLLNYESGHQKFPGISGQKPNHGAVDSGLSWRVHLLPFLEERELYDRFHLDESWDSPHNLALLPEMPEGMESHWPKGMGSVKPGYTLYQRPTGNGAFDAGDGTQTTFADITDGSSNTIMIVQVDPAAAVPWTKPADYAFDPQEPLRSLGKSDENSQQARVWLGVRVDGSCFSFTQEGLPTRIISSLFTKAGGEEIPGKVW